MSTLITLFVVGLVTMVVAGVALSLVGVFFSLALTVAGVLLFKVAPILLVGWVVLKVVEHWRRPDRLSASDRRWLEGE